MCIKLVEYIPCRNCAYNLIGKSEKANIYFKQTGQLCLKLQTHRFVLRVALYKKREFKLRKLERIRKNKRFKSRKSIRICLKELMPVEVLNGCPCKSCGGWEIEKRKDCDYCWVDFRILLVENTTEYICSWCKSTLICVIEHKEEKYN